MYLFSGYKMELMNCICTYKKKKKTSWQSTCHGFSGRLQSFFNYYFVFHRLLYCSMKYKFYVHIFISCTEWEGDVLIYIYIFFS